MNKQYWERAFTGGPSEDSPGRQTLTLSTAEREENSGLEVALGYTVVLIFKQHAQPLSTLYEEESSVLICPKNTATKLSPDFVEGPLGDKTSHGKAVTGVTPLRTPAMPSLT